MRNLSTRRLFSRGLANPEERKAARADAQHLADDIQRPVAVYAYDNPGKLILRVKPRYRYMDDIRKRNKAAGGCWFEPSTMRFFSSRIQSAFYGAKDGRAYFVTSERGPNGRRAYSVRVAQLDGSIDTVGAFQGYPTGRTAHAAAKRAAAGFADVADAGGSRHA